jgi:hypothetical protein
MKSLLVFVYFINATEMNGPDNECEWHGATRLIHAALGLSSRLDHRGVFDAFVNVTHLRTAV